MPTLKVIQNRMLSEDTFVLRTERLDSEVLAGQCFSLGTPDLGINREYSIYSGANEDFFEFLIRCVDGGAVSSRLSRLLPGSPVQIGGPYGKFCLNENLISKTKFLFVASGTGIAPFHSFVMTYPEINYEIIHGIRFESEMYDFNKYSAPKYIPAVSRPTSSKPGIRVTDILRERRFDADEIVYLCGNRSMIIDCVQILRRHGIHGDSIFMETFF